jgi:hypothetical protein
MIMLNQFILEGKLLKYVDFCQKMAVEFYDDTDKSLVIEYDCNEEAYTAYLSIKEDMLPKYTALAGKLVRVVGKLAGDTLVVEHLEALG